MLSEVVDKFTIFASPSQEKNSQVEWLPNLDRS